jgi:hypothetical protein
MLPKNSSGRVAIRFDKFGPMIAAGRGQMTNDVNTAVAAVSGWFINVSLGGFRALKGLDDSKAKWSSDYTKAYTAGSNSAPLSSTCRGLVAGDLRPLSVILQDFYFYFLDFWGDFSPVQRPLDHGAIFS